MKKLKLILATMSLAIPVVSLATNYAALEKELETAQPNSQLNYGGMQQGFEQQKQQNIARSIYDQNRGVSQSYSEGQGNNINTTSFEGQQKQQNIARSIYDQNRESISQRQQGNNIKTTYFGDQQEQQNSNRSIYDQNREFSQRQHSYNSYQGSNIGRTEFGGKQRNSPQSSDSSGESLFEHNQ
ncbi:hypothetical protein [Francisella sp. 19X1-34]|uniref:hypothetical protein n=1 Tax=Francisella sp. 19X1-34 TaxID=3087177 RepID=UPI002E36CC67|nr:hypothetical protein [Francisella sp. 19X1-34]MED7788332.1 hypothetical protein [Francisella sp. 19X1-34]